MKGMDFFLQHLAAAPSSIKTKSPLEKTVKASTNSVSSSIWKNRNHRHQGRHSLLPVRGEMSSPTCRWMASRSLSGSMLTLNREHDDGIWSISGRLAGSQPKRAERVPNPWKTKITPEEAKSLHASDWPWEWWERLCQERRRSPSSSYSRY